MCAFFVYGYIHDIQLMYVWILGDFFGKEFQRIERIGVIFDNIWQVLVNFRWWGNCLILGECGWVLTVDV